jgi:hypothetical protein
VEKGEGEEVTKPESEEWRRARGDEKYNAPLHPTVLVRVPVAEEVVHCFGDDPLSIHL